MFLTQVVSCFLLLTTLNIKVPLILRVGPKLIGRVEFEHDWSVGLGATLGDATDRKLKKYFSSYKDFSWKS